MMLGDILEASVHVLTQEQDNQNKLNSKRSARLSQWAGGVGHKPLPTIHSGNDIAYTITELD